MPKVAWARLDIDSQYWSELEVLQLVMVYGMLERSAMKARWISSDPGLSQDESSRISAYASDTARAAMDILDLIVTRLAKTTTNEEYIYSSLAMRAWPTGAAPT